MAVTGEGDGTKGYETGYELEDLVALVEVTEHRTDFVWGIAKALEGELDYHTSYLLKLEPTFDFDDPEFKLMVPLLNSTFGRYRYLRAYFDTVVKPEETVQAIAVMLWGDSEERDVFLLDDDTVDDSDEDETEYIQTIERANDLLENIPGISEVLGIIEAKLVTLIDILKQEKFSDRIATIAELSDLDYKGDFITLIETK